VIIYTTGPTSTQLLHTLSKGAKYSQHPYRDGGKEYAQGMMSSALLWQVLKVSILTGNATIWGVLQGGFLLVCWVLFF